MRVLIIGAAGFVGRHLTAHFKELGFKTYTTKLLHEELEGAINLDILDVEAIKNLLLMIKPTCIVNLAGQSSVAMSWNKPALTVDVNIRGAVNILEAVKDIDRSIKVLLIGSGEEYGDINEEDCPISETLSVKPSNIYAVTKMAQNQLGRVYSQAFKMDVVMTRAFNHIGTGQLETFVVPSFCKQAAEIENNLRPAVISVGNLNAKRDFTDVRDIVRAYALLCQKGISGETYNVGSGKAVTLHAVLEKILSLCSKTIEVVVDPGKIRPFDIPVIVANTEKLKKLTGWQPEISLEQTLTEIFEGYK